MPASLPCDESSSPEIPDGFTVIRLSDRRFPFHGQNRPAARNFPHWNKRLPSSSPWGSASSLIQSSSHVPPVGGRRKASRSWPIAGPVSVNIRERRHRRKARSRQSHHSASHVTTSTADSAAPILRDSHHTMSKEEAQARYLAALAARAYSEEQQAFDHTEVEQTGWQERREKT